MVREIRKTRQDKHWCPNQCGKKLMFFCFVTQNQKRYGLFKCKRCEQVFVKSKKEEVNWLVAEQVLEYGQGRTSAEVVG